MVKILALSSSRVSGGGYLESAAPLIKEFIGSGSLTVAFIPFASVDSNYDQYKSIVQKGLFNIPLNIELVDVENARSIIQGADVIMTGGGNTFKLLHDLYQLDLLELIRNQVKAGIHYVGWSAGANITGLTIGTTNDMPIIQPQSFAALSFLPFQINPHYLNQQWEGFHGETRDQRLEEFVKLNPRIPVVGLPEGTALRLRDRKLEYLGTVPGMLLQTSDANLPLRKTILPGHDLSFLL